MKVTCTGSGGFIGLHLSRRLKKEGNWIRGVDIKYPEFSNWKDDFDEFLILDLREYDNCVKAVDGVDEVYNLAANMGGMGWIHSFESEIMHDNVLINVNMVEATAKAGIKKYFYSSSVCVYPDMKKGDKELTEDEAYPAHPDNEYGWEKLYSERVLMAYARKFGIDAKIARFQNTYGPMGTWQGGREKAPAALCRKVAQAEDEIEVWGDGTAIRSYTYIDDLIDGIRRLIDSDLSGPTNIGYPKYYTVDELAKIIMQVAGKDLKIKHIEGPVGVKSRNFSNDKIYKTGWQPKWDLVDGIKPTYEWIRSQVEAKYNN